MPSAVQRAGGGWRKPDGRVGQCHLGVSPGHQLAFDQQVVSLPGPRKPVALPCRNRLIGVVGKRAQAQDHLPVLRPLGS